MKKAKNGTLKSHDKIKDDFDRDVKMRRLATPPKQKKPISIYDNFDDEDDIEEYHIKREDEESDDIWDYVDDDDN